MDDRQPHREFLRPGEAAAILHVTPKTLVRWVAQGRLQCIVTLGGHRRFRREDVKAAEATMLRGEPTS